MGAQEMVEMYIDNMYVQSNSIYILTIILLYQFYCPYDQFTFFLCAEEPSLLISEQYELLNLGLRSSSIQAVIAPGQKAIFSLDYDQREQRVYWVSLEEESIKYAFHRIKDNIGTIVKGKNTLFFCFLIYLRCIYLR